MKTPFKLGFFIILCCCVWFAIQGYKHEREIQLPDGSLVAVSTHEYLVYQGSHRHEGDQRYKGDIYEETKRILETWDHPEAEGIYAPPTGILLYGPPGTGKTTLACQLCRETGANLLILSPDTLENKYQGESFKRMRATFTLAKKIAPCVVFFDEIDGLMSKRSEMDQSHTNTMKTLFLSGMDSVKGHRVLVIGATNRPEALDSALMRRLEVHLETKYPTDDDLKDYLKTHLGNEYSEFVESLEYKLTLHKMYTFLKFCARRFPVKAKDRTFSDQDLITLYQEYNTIYSFTG